MRNGRPTRVAAMQAHGESIRLVVLCAKDSPEVLEAVAIEPSQFASVREVLKRHKVERVVGVVPAAQSVCRCVELPAGGGDLADTIALLAETQLPSEIPAHRRAGGLVHGGIGGRLVALLTAWNEHHEPPFVTPSGVEPTCWVTQVAAMQALRGERLGAIAYADRTAGTISIFASGARATVARILREGNADVRAWADAVTRAIDETCETTGTTAETVGRQGDDRSLLIATSDAAALSTKVQGISRDAAWIETYGIALGAALVASSADADRRSLAAMTIDAGSSHEPAPARAARWISRPRNVWCSGAVAAALLLLVPLAIAWGRTAILEAKVSAAKAQVNDSRETAKRVAVYNEVDRNYLPVTKVLADLSRATPIGIEIDSVRFGSADDGIQIDGRAQNSAQIIAFQTTLNKSGVFERAQSGRTQSTEDGLVEFSLTTFVWSAHASFNGGTDYADESIAQRLYSVENASNLNWKPASGLASSGEPSQVDTDRANGSRPPRSSRGGGSTPVRSSVNAKPASGAVPEPITAEELAQTDRLALMRARMARSAALRATDDEELKARLTEDIRKLQERLNELQAGGAP
jgi:Tfp pilus assembly protein PilN